MRLRHIILAFILVAAGFARLAYAQFMPFSFFRQPSTTTYRYYRLLATSRGDTCGLGASDGGLSGLQFYWSGAWQTNSMSANSSGTIGGYAATVSASSSVSATYDPWKAFDGSTATAWIASSSFSSTPPYNSTTSTWVKVDFGAGNGPTIDGVRVAGIFGTYESCSIDSWEIQRSTDDVTWSTISGSAITGRYIGDDEATVFWSPVQNPTSPNATVDHAGKITVSWSGHATSTNYKVAYQETSAPADCSSGWTTSTAGTSVGVYGLSHSQAYGFRICAENGSGVSTGVTTSGTTSSATWYSGVTYTTSGNYGSCLAATGTNMNDESTSSKSSWFGQSTGPERWIIADLGSTQTVSYVRLGGAGPMDCATNPSNYWTNNAPGILFYTSTDGTNWTLVNDREILYRNDYLSNVFIGTDSVRYVRILTGGSIGLGQFRVGY